MAKKDFIQQMVKDTISFSQEYYSDNVLPLSFKGAFEISAFYDRKRKCYILHNESEVLEIPRNWGPFRNRVSIRFQLSKYDDKDNFVEILSLFFNKDLEHVQVNILNGTDIFDHQRAA
ncbi:MAG: hypothetical protein QF441_14615 [Bacteriovoracaceae bacterium]|jgi:hypothetical protein|nr:hypothetical protein [Halobacteriovoraceae bacterium]MDP7321837.1 hypothetical protein [Bacteriovoracaceae bacterium]|tara:strand:+ start:178 stop:531 length:354 start_codon:yes stop_codon:yes gene_type:complete